MEDLELGLDILAKETLDLNTILRSQDLSDFGFESSDLVFDKIEYPQTPGFVYRVEKSPGHFRIRGNASSCIKESFESIGADAMQWSFFQTGTVELAEVIMDQLANRRFASEEDFLCSINDPGPNWWMQLTDNSFKIYFNACGVGKLRGLIDLGPLGDSMVAKVRFAQMAGYLGELFPISEVVSNEKYFHVVAPTGSDKNFEKFKKIFLEGECRVDFENIAPTTKLKTLDLYLRELASIRKFWAIVTDSLESKIDRVYQ